MPPRQYLTIDAKSDDCENVILCDSPLEEAAEEEEGCESQSSFSYLFSSDFRELLVCFVFRICTDVLFLYDAFPHERPMPVQYLANSGEYVRNLMYNEASQPSSVSPFWHSFLSYYIPPLIQMGLAIISNQPGHKHAVACVYIVAFGLTNLATEALKLYVGHFRPFFFDKCQPDATYETCTEDATSARKSFPSGHASMSFCGLLLLTLYVQRFWGVDAVRRSDNKSSKSALYRARFISMLSLLPMALAAFFAASRIVDNKHFPADVVAGSVLGASLSYFTHHLWF